MIDSASLIAHAPSDLRYLLDELAAARAKMEEIRSATIEECAKIAEREGPRWGYHTDASSACNCAAGNIRALTRAKGAEG